MMPVLFDHSATSTSDGQNFDFVVSRVLEHIGFPLLRNPSELRDPDPIILAHIDGKEELGPIFAAVV